VARTNSREVRRPEDWFPPVRSIDTPSTTDVDAAIAAAFPIAESDVTNLVADLASKLDDSQAGVFGLTLLAVADLAAAKAALAYTKSDVGLGNVDNTSDANKPVSTAQQTALDAKRNVGTVDSTLQSTSFLVNVDATAGNQTVNLPAAASSANRLINIKKIDATANTVTVDGNGAETIDGATTKVLTVQWESVTVICDGTSWFIL